MPFKRLLQLIEGESIFFSHLSRMDDKWEGLLTKKTREAFFRSELGNYGGNVDAANGFIHQYESGRNEFYINCWHISDHESYLMWKAYANKECAVQTTYERLSASFENTPACIDGCVIEYIDYERDEFPIGNSYFQIGYKDLPYRDEKEFRLLFWRVSEKNKEIQTGENGVSIRVDLKMLIDNIYLNPSCIPNVEELDKLIKAKGLDCQIRNTKIWE